MLKRLTVGVLCSCSLLLSQTPAKIDFRRDVQPVLKAHCYGCHGPALQMNRFRLDRRSDAMKGGTISVIGPGNAEGSRLYQRLIGNQFGMQMPPTGPLQPEHIALIKAWIDQGAEWPDDLAGETPSTPPHPKAARLMDALRRGDTALFRKMLAEEPAIARLRGPAGSTPLMYAALYADNAAVRLLLDAGADANARNDAGATALMWAADDLEKTRLLLDRGAGVNTRSEDGRTPVLIASGIVGNTAVLQLLLDRGADLSVKAPGLVGDSSPLLEAMLAGNQAAFHTLVSHGADPKAAGPAALALSMRANCRACIDTLLKDPTPALVNPAMFIVSPPLGPGFGIASLLPRGGDPNAKDPKGNSIIAMAAASEAFPVEALKLLVERGADVNGTSALGETALELAKRHGQTPVVELLTKAGARESAAPDPLFRPRPASSTRAAVERSLPLLQRNDTAFLRKSGCVSCHNNTLTAVTVEAARRRGFAVDEEQVSQRSRTISAYLESWRERVLQNAGIPGDSDTISYILQGLAAAKYPPDPATDALARYLKLQQLPDGHWALVASRPPIESSEVEVTAVSMRALQVYAPKSKQAEYERAVRLASNWLAKAQPRSTEDRAYQILGLNWSGGSRESIRKAAAALLAEQRPDGGWAQIPSLRSDAYATGQALVALQESGAITPSHPAGQRAVKFLLDSQAEDGSWYVKRRAMPIQPHFESGFPYGRDQFISAAATNWATTALAMASRD